MSQPYRKFDYKESVQLSQAAREILAAQPKPRQETAKRVRVNRAK